jgi:SAM-dependent methyltransferase
MPSLNPDMAAYYRKRAREYDAVYAIEARAADLATLRDWLADRVHGCSVLEVAAGTGYWTQAASSACNIVATDVNPETLAVAAAKSLEPHVTLRVADAFDLPLLDRPPEIGMAHLWWSHLLRLDQDRFLRHLASRLRPRATLLMIDETYVRHISTPLSRQDLQGNTYQTRMLDSGELFEVVKNYPDEPALLASLAPVCEAILVLWLRHFWVVSATFR